MKSIWITYAWEDNKNKDVDFAAQELMSAGLDVKLDRWNLNAGKRLWEQIEHFIQDQSLSDGWLLYATQASVGNEKCKEEYSYALGRALEKRGGDFPIIALFPASVDNALIPAGIKTRLFVSLIDPDWKERIVAAVEKRAPNISKPHVEPYAITVHKSGEQFIIEMRPHAGTWCPFIVCIPAEEKDRLLPHLHHGAANRPPVGNVGTVLFGYKEGTSSDGKLWLISASNEATPTQSYYLLCKSLPSLLIFGIEGASPQFHVQFRKNSQ
ncbi:MAG: toll/interleukin-1 receptor domain-containing protein [Chloroflexota bacterium]